MTESAGQMLLAATGVWLAVYGLAALIGAGLYRYFAHQFGGVAAEQRSALLLTYAALPLLVAVLVSVLLYFPALADAFLPQHCHGEPCAPHAPQFAASAAYVATVLAITAVILWQLVLKPVRQLHRSLQRSSLLRRLAARDPYGRFRVIDSESPAAWCEGLWRPGIYISRGLLNNVSAAELDVVLAHEQAHAERRDNLLALLLNWATRIWPRRARLSLRRDLALAAELACDAQAARAAGGAARVANLISNLDQARDSRVLARLDGLQRAVAPDAGSPARVWLAMGMLWMLQAGSFSYIAHQSLEWLNGRI